MSSIEQFRTRLIPSASLTEAQIDDICRLRVRSLARDFSNVPEEQRGAFVSDAVKSMKHPNRGVGNRGIRANQVYAKAVSVLVINTQNDTLAAHATVANNASKPSKESLEKLPAVAVEPARTALMYAKLLAPFGGYGGRNFAASRYIHFGYVPLSEEARRNIAETDMGSASVMDHILVAGMLDRLPEQKVSIYPYGPEHDFKTGLQKAGMAPDPDYTSEVVHPFGESWPVTQEHWTSAPAGLLMAELLHKSGAVNRVLRDGVEYGI